MKFDVISLIFNPFMLMFIAIATGLLFGKIKFGKFNFGTSGSLFTGLFIGWLIYKIATKIVLSGESTAGYEAAQKLLQNNIIHSYLLETALIFFVAAIGLLAAKDMGVVLKKYGTKFVVMAMVITFVGAGITYASMAVIDTNPYEVSGVYVGSLTSSPGLGAALETAQNHAEEYADTYSEQPDDMKQLILSIIDSSGKLTPENTQTLTKEQKSTYISNAQAGVGVGYAISYPFGVIIVIFAVNFFSSIFRMNVEDEKKLFEEEMREARQLAESKTIPTTYFNMISFSIVSILGYLLGSIEIYLGPLGYFSLGSTGGVLIMGLLLGYIGKIGPISFRMDQKSLVLLREIGLVFFLAIVGLKYGYCALDALMGSGVTLAILALVVGIIAMLVGFLVGRYIFKINWVMLSGAICGGMTSTPGLGAAIDALDSNEPATGYGATYPFALLGMIIFTIILNKLPLL
ncbi:aspartate-alanine antiporter-like transporter [Anaerovorax odorimutans]|uniref:aspartate-alanine antiporter-like transporter n=1 Tax=Anaerovorax odorimutans TaxID=109327 RepID=UPI0003FB9154|nr:membrane protein [Anaerovorax odorimutans]